MVCNGETFFACSFVASDEAVLRFNQLVEFLAEFRLDGATERAEAEAMAFRSGGLALVRADGECTVPAEKKS